MCVHQWLIYGLFPPDIWNALFRTFVLRTKSRSTSIFVSVTMLVGETFIITDHKSMLFLLIPLSAGHSSIKWFAVWSSSSQRSQMGSWSGSHFEMWYLKGPWPVTNLMISLMSFLFHVLILLHGVAVGSHFLVWLPYMGSAAHSSCHLACSLFDSRSFTWSCLKLGYMAYA